jgi:hypothetical protein
MDIRSNTEKKARAFIRQIDGLLLSDFPHSATEDALHLIKKFFEDQLARLTRASATKDLALLQSVCVTINQRIVIYLPILGLLLRSTNTRNSFEAYYAFAEISEALLGPKASVIFSSEWDFSPLTYPLSVPALPNYVLLGMPSTESSNALIFPLAGHELGHSVWMNENLETQFASETDEAAKQYLKDNWPTFITAFTEHAHIQPTDDELANNMFLKLAISDITQLALYQIEEIFCDAIGAHLFGQSYALAFHYLLAPNLGGDRPLEYPTLQNRADFIAKFGGVDLAKHGFPDFKSEFLDRQPPMRKRQGFTSTAADAIGVALAKKMYEQAHNIIVSKAGKFAADISAQTSILVMFEHSVPAHAPRSLPDIINAGWAYFQANAASFNEAERELIEWISELILKSIEVLEFRSRLGNA